MAGRIASQGKRSQVHPVSIIKEAGSQTSAKENQAVVKSPPLRKAPEAPQSGAVRQPLQGTQLVNKSVAPLLEAPACKVVADKSKGVTGNAKAQGAVAASHLRHMSDDADKVKRESCGPSEDSATGNGLKQRKVLQKGAPPLLPTPVLEAVDPRACLLAGDAEASLEDKGPLQPAGTLTTKAGALSATTGSLPAAGSENAGGEKKNKAARRKEREPWRDPGPKDIVGPQRSRSRSEELKKQSVSAEGAGPKVQNEERVQEGWNEGVAGVAVVDPQRVVVDGAAGASSGTKEKKGSSRGQRRRVEDSPGNREAQQNAAEVLENKPKLESGAVRVEAASKPENPSVEGSGPKVGEGNEAVAWSAVAGESKEESGAERAVSDGAGKEAGGQQEQPSDEEGWMKVKKVRGACLEAATVPYLKMAKFSQGV